MRVVQLHEEAFKFTAASNLVSDVIAFISLSNFENLPTLATSTPALGGTALTLGRNGTDSFPTNFATGWQAKDANASTSRWVMHRFAFRKNTEG